MKILAAFNRLSPLRRLALLLLLFLLLRYPGQNWYQTIHLSPGAPLIQPVVLPEPLPLPVSDSTPPPDITAASYIVFEPDSGTILAQKNSSAHLPMASTTKLMTALVALDTYTLDQVLTVNTADSAVGNTMKLIRGDSLTVRSLLYGLLVSSGNDAALALAENYPAGYQAFVAAMNAKAAALNLKNTHYQNVSGLDSSDHYTSVHDLALIAKHTLANDVLVEIVSTRDITVTNTTATNSYRLTTTNELLGRLPGVMGVKTGWTEKAGECLVTFTDRGGRRLIVVVLGSSDRFGESARLINWAYDHHTWTEIN